MSAAELAYQMEGELLALYTALFSLPAPYDAVYTAEFDRLFAEIDALNAEIDALKAGKQEAAA